MRNLTRRIKQLERRAGVGNQPGIRMVGGVGLALDAHRCVEILEESGFATPGPGILLVNLVEIPEGLDAEQSERYLREHGERICFRA